jgi:hypothetical protein
MPKQQKKVSYEIVIKCEKLLDTVEHEAVSRSFQASNELRNAAQLVLRGQRTGRRYRMPYTGTGQKVTKTGKIRKRKPRYYTASAPGEPPANRTGAFRESWQPAPRAIKKGERFVAYAAIGSDIKVKKGQGRFLGDLLEYGSEDGRIKPRPYKQKIIERARPAIKRIYQAPYVT